jgi:hypothetical protein
MIDTTKKHQLTSLLKMYNLDYIVNFPTRINEYSETSIDNIFLDRSKYKSFVVEPHINGLSDHDAQMLTLYVPSHKFCKLTKYVRKYDDYSINTFKLNLSYENWDNVFNSKCDSDINVPFNNFLNTYIRIFYGSFPVHSISVDNKTKGWLTKGILISCEHKKGLYLLYRSSKNLAIKNHYRKYCKVLTRTIQLAKKLYYNGLISRSENKTKEAWRIIKSLTNKHPNSKEDFILDNDGESINNPQIITETLNDYFINSVAETVDEITKQDKNNDYGKEGFKQYLVNSFQQTFSSINLKAVTEKEIFEIITTLKGTTSPGYDEIPNWIVKLSFPFISSPLTYLCNRMLSLGTYPNRLKYAQVFPLFKKGSKKEKANYRPV